MKRIANRFILCLLRQYMAEFFLFHIQFNSKIFILLLDCDQICGCRLRLFNNCMFRAYISLCCACCCCWTSRCNSLLLLRIVVCSSASWTQGSAVIFLPAQQYVTCVSRSLNTSLCCWNSKARWVARSNSCIFVSKSASKVRKSCSACDNFAVTSSSACSVCAFNSCASSIWVLILSNLRNSKSHSSLWTAQQIKRPLFALVELNLLDGQCLCRLTQRCTFCF